jgi:hypothetical protein
MPRSSYADLFRDWQGQLEEEEALSERTRSARLRTWRRLLAALQENQSDLPHLEIQRAELEDLLRQTGDLIQVQAALAAIKQGATKQLSALLSDGQRLATVVRLSLKQHYGPAADKLEAFGIQPRQSRKQREAAG